MPPVPDAQPGGAGHAGAGADDARPAGRVRQDPEGPGNGEAELWRYVSLRVPLLISRFLPFSVLLGALIAFVGLNQHSEVVSMKAPACRRIRYWRR